MSAKEAGMTDAPMTIETACDLANNYRTKIAVPFEKLAEVLQVAKDSANTLKAHQEQIPLIEGRINALKIEEAGALARMRNATARADDAEKLADIAVQTAQGRGAEAVATADQKIANIAQEINARRTALEMEYTQRKMDLDGAILTAQARLDGLKAEYDGLVASFKAKFG
jgi:uncharacterized phage infection (PIP) family protein YhgE